MIPTNDSVAPLREEPRQGPDSSVEVGRRSDDLRRRAQLALARMDSSYVYYGSESPPVIVRGQDARLYDADGKEYLDLVSGFSAVNQGHCHPAIVAALVRQASRLTHTHQTLSDPKISLAEKLRELSPVPDAVVHFDVGGTRAVEATLLIVAAYTGKRKFVSFRDSFHGRSMGALSVHDLRTNAGLMAAPNNHYEVSYPHCFRCPVGRRPDDCALQCTDDLERVCETRDDVGAVIVEPVLGARGYVFPPDDFLRRVRKACDRHGLVMIDDEVQMAFGRTGYMFACEASSVVPDVILVSKSLCGGMWPLSAVIGRRAIMQSVPPGTFGSTFAGSPLACAVALAALEVVQSEDLCRRSAQRGRRFLQKLHDLATDFWCLSGVEGRGLAIGLEVVEMDGVTPAPSLAARIVGCGLEHGLLLQRGGRFNNRITLIPPLTISDEDVDVACSRLRSVLVEVCI